MNERFDTYKASDWLNMLKPILSDLVTKNGYHCDRIYVMHEDDFDRHLKQWDLVVQIDTKISEPDEHRLVNSLREKIERYSHFPLNPVLVVKISSDETIERSFSKRLYGYYLDVMHKLGKKWRAFKRAQSAFSYYMRRQDRVAANLQLLIEALANTQPDDIQMIIQSVEIAQLFAKDNGKVHHQNCNKVSASRYPKIIVRYEYETLIEHIDTTNDQYLRHLEAHFLTSVSEIKLPFTIIFQYYGPRVVELSMNT